MWTQSQCTHQRHLCVIQTHDVPIKRFVEFSHEFQLLIETRKKTIIFSKSTSCSLAHWLHHQSIVLSLVRQSNIISICIIGRRPAYWHYADNTNCQLYQSLTLHWHFNFNHHHNGISVSLSHCVCLYHIHSPNHEHRKQKKKNLLTDFVKPFLRAHTQYELKWRTLRVDLFLFLLFFFRILYVLWPIINQM